MSGLPGDGALVATLRCSGCGAEVDPAQTLPFRCPAAADGDDVDHVLAGAARPEAFPPSPPAADDPFRAYRRGLTAYRVGRAAGLSDARYLDLAGALDERLRVVDGRGFRRSPLRRLEGPPGVTILGKDETGQPSGSHKGRHLYGVMLYLRVLEAAGSPLAVGLSGRPLAIASCGNAALAAAVVARAAEWPLHVFIPDDAPLSVVARLRELGAQIHVCRRTPGQAGDPCVRGFRAAVAEGALPFGVQGDECGLAIEGGRTLGWELAAQLADEGLTADHLFVQVGGGALASGTVAGLRDAVAAGMLAALPTLHTVQTHGAWPLARALRAAQERRTARPDEPLDATLAFAARHRSAFMWPWETAPHSVAHGILDDETYDWLALVAAMLETGGRAIVAPEATLELAAAGLPGISATGAAGLAGLLHLWSDEAQDAVQPGERVIVLLTGARR